MKTLIWAGLGLFISMTLTTIWISRDLKTIRADNQRRHQAECARAQQAAGASTSAADPLATSVGTANGSPTLSQSTPAAQPAAKACAAAAGSSASTATQQPASSGATSGTYGSDTNAGYSSSSAPATDQYAAQQQYQPTPQAQGQAQYQPQAGSTVPTYSSADAGGPVS